MLDVFILYNAVGPHGETILALIPRTQTKFVFPFACPHFTTAVKDFGFDVFALLGKLF